MTPNKPTTALTALRVQRGQPAGQDSPLGRLLRRSNVLALEHVYHIPKNGNANPTIDMSLWMVNSDGRIDCVPIIRPNHPASYTPASYPPDPDIALAVVEAMNTDLTDIVHKTDDFVGITEGGYIGNVRVFFMVDGWVLADQCAETNADRFAEWMTAFAQNVDAEALQEATDDVDWQRFCVPFLPKPTSAHNALAQQTAAERLVATTLAIHQASGLPNLKRLDWTIGFR